MRLPSFHHYQSSRAYTVRPTTDSGFAIVGFTEAYGPETGPRMSITTPTLLSLLSQAFVPGRTNLGGSSFTMRAWLFDT